MLGVEEVIRSLERQEESYWDKLTRIAKSPYSRLVRSDHHGIGETTYILAGTNGFIPIRSETMSMMEFGREKK